MNASRRFYSVVILGFASAIPLSLLSSGVIAWFSYFHLPLMQIGFLSLLTLPYILKFLWAPFLDYSIFSFLDRRLSWIFLMQLCMGILFAFLIYLDPRHDLTLIAVVCVLLSFCSATQDIAVDAQRAEILNPEERGLGASYYLMAYRIGILFSGGLGWVVADHAGWAAYFAMLFGVFFLLALNNFILPHVPSPKMMNHQFNLLAPVVELMQRRHIMLILIFISLYKFGDALGLSLITNFFMNGLHFSLSELGVSYKTIGIVATLFGAFIGGLILMRYSLFMGLMLFGFMQAISLLFFAVMAVAPIHHVFLVLGIFIENFAGGMSSAAFMALLVAWCHPNYTATQYAIFSAVASLGRVFLGPVAGWMVLKFHWAWFFIFASLCGLPSLVLLLWIWQKKLLPEH